MSGVRRHDLGAARRRPDRPTVRGVDASCSSSPSHSAASSRSSCYPSEMTHASVRGTELEVPESVVRLSVGIEDVDDLIDDLLRALDAL